MPDSPPPAYSKEYNNNPPAASHHNRLGDGTQTLNSSKRADGRGARPLPLPPSLKTATVSPLRLHKKSQSEAIPSIERPWKPPYPPDRRDRYPAAANPPQFRNREADSVLMPQKYLRSPPPTPVPMQFGRTVSHSPMPPPNRGGEALHGLPQGGAIDPNAFYNPAVSGHLPRSSISHMPSRNNTPLGNNRPIQAPSSRPSNGPHVRWG
ncbi:hypothetical protein B0H16DRAFT_1497474 [Mycena metata]|uniref:Uncharacterized protein n=1 Tax=Mycena metata TaxID=1033252 RepID=A0AAD7NZ95_9AGAR|nr:hypothetical protein B0H16DRAFT_1497474 [Mycena metata]